jgi:hypothetical protein
VHVQFAPEIPVAVNPTGTVSLTETVVLVARPPELVTVMVYVAPVWPCVKLPTWVLVMVMSGGPEATVYRKFGGTYEVFDPDHTFQVDPLK